MRFGQTTRPMQILYVYFKDLASRTLMFENKKFHLDMKENQRGRFIKIAEVSQEGRKNQIMMSLSTAGVFNKNLSHFVDFYHDLDSHFADNFKQVKTLLEKYVT